MKTRSIIGIIMLVFGVMYLMFGITTLNGPQMLIGALINTGAVYVITRKPKTEKITN